MYSSPSFQIWWFIRGMQVTTKKNKITAKHLHKLCQKDAGIWCDDH